MAVPNLGTRCAFYASVTKQLSLRFGVESLRMKEVKSMEKRDNDQTRPTGEGTGKEAAASPWGRYWARQKRTPQDSHLISFGERVTYTFVLGNDVASLHYDQGRGKLFYKGHRITRENMEPWLVKLLQHFKAVLAESEYAERFSEGYNQLLGKLMEKKTKQKPSGEK